MGTHDGTVSGKQADSEPNPDGKTRWPLIIALIGALGAILAALIPTLFTQLSNHNNLCAENLTITSPSDGQAVTSGPTKGIEVIGKACNLGDSTDWLFDHDLDDGYYYLDYSTTFPAPVAVNNGGWAFYDASIGNKGDEDVTYQITVVLASPQCTDQLKSAKPDPSGDIRFGEFPPGCRIEDTVAVVVTYP